MHTYAGYSGPWLENQWIEYFTPQHDISEWSYTKRFGSFVPLFVRWADLWASDLTGYKYIVNAVCNLLSSHHLYITVSQHDDGITAKRGLGWSPPCSRKSIVVLSSGGSGNVIAPLLKAPESLRRPSTSPDYLLVFAGSRSRIRRPIIKSLRAEIGHDFGYYKGGDFRTFWDRGRFILTPRGYGKSAFMVYEALQMGFVPVYVWKEEEWIPYKGSVRADLRNLGFSINICNVSKLPQTLRHVTDAELESRRESIRRVRITHFTYQGVLEQIEKFLQLPCRAELKVHFPLSVCPLPISLRDVQAKQHL